MGDYINLNSKIETNTSINRNIEIYKIKKIISEYKIIYENLLTRKNYIISKILDIDNVCDSYCYKSISTDTDNVTGSSNISNDNIFKTYLKREYYRRDEELVVLKIQLNEIKQSEDEIERIFLCYYKSELLVPVAFYIVNELLVKKSNIRTMTWDSMTKEISKSKSYIKESYDIVFNIIKILYESNLANLEIMKLNKETLYNLINNTPEIYTVIDKY